MTYLKKKLKEKSTWLGLLSTGITLLLTNGVVTPDVVVSVFTALGLITVDEAPKGV